jgi:peroxidase
MGGPNVISTSATASCSLGVLVLLLWSAVGTVQCRHYPPTPAGLSEDFYAKSCPQLFDIVEAGVKNALRTDVRITASLLRVSFHDCWIGGCDASLLLDNDTTRGIVSEKFAPANNASIRGFPVLDAIKAQLEAVCPRTVSCADLVTVAARDSVALAGGQGWPVVLGRRDSLTSHFSQSASNGSDGLPSPFVNLSLTIGNFAFRNFSATEMVTLSGSHTFGRARCAVVTPRFTNDPRFHLNDTNVIDPKLKEKLLKHCANAPDPNFVINDLDQTTPNTFDNKYYTNLEKELGVLHTDQNLFSAKGANTGLVKLYGQKQNLFFSEFARGMIKMQNLGPLTGKQGQIRLHCGKVNPSSSSSSSWTSSAESLLAVE